jgi:arginine/ornithine N-succinyltransferase beta subunit
VPVNGLFDRDYVDVYDAENSGPRFACELADMPNVVHGDELEITTADFGEETYIVRTVKKDGLGVVALKLELQDG